jgi:hypothetical protein
MTGFREKAVTVFMKMKPRVNQRRPGPDVDPTLGQGSGGNTP